MRDTVVLIEDDEFIAAALVDLLSCEGYLVTRARTLRQAVGALGRIEGRCLVLLDPLVPGVSAAGVLAALAGAQLLLTVSVIVAPESGGDGVPGSRPRTVKRLLSPDLLLDLVRDSFADGERAAWAPPRRLAA